MTTNDATTREALVDASDLRQVMDDFGFSVNLDFNDEHDDVSHTLLSMTEEVAQLRVENARLLADEFQKGYSQRFADEKKYADRAAPEPDADPVEAVAKALFAHEKEATGATVEWDGILENYGRNGVAGKAVYRDLAKIALSAVPTVQTAAGDDLDAMLNSVHPNTTASLQFIQPYLTTDPEPYWQAHVIVPTGGLTGFQKHRGTGPTRIAAIQNAVEAAKEATQ